MPTLNVTFEAWRCAQCGVVFWLDPLVHIVNWEPIHSHGQENTTTARVSANFERIGTFLFKLVVP